MIKLAFRNLVRGNARNLLTLSGVATSIALFVSLTTISSSLKEQLDQTMILAKVDVIVQEKGAATPVASRLDDQLVPGLEQLPDIRSVTPVTIGSIGVSGPHASLPYVFMFGINPSKPASPMGQQLVTAITDGRMFQHGQNEILLGRLAARRLQLSVGDHLRVGSGKQYVISGIYWLEQGILDGGIIVDLKDSQQLLTRKGYVNMVLIEARNKQDVGRLLRLVPKQFPGTDAIRSQSLRKQVRAMSMIDGFIGAVSAVAMIMGSLLMLNTLLMAVSERTREIGMLMAMGWSRVMLMQLIVSEALLIGLGGGILGYILTFPVLKGLAMLPATGPGWVPPAPSPGFFFTAIGIAIAIAVLSSLYPAFSATRMSPATALRYE